MPESNETEKRELHKFYFTFGSGHYTLTPDGLLCLGNYYVLINAYTNGQAREIMCKYRKDVWAFNYTAEQFEGQAEEFNLKLLCELTAPTPYDDYATAEL